jgi:hypothetical protein
VAEGGGLLNRYRGSNPYRGFESPRLRHMPPQLSTIVLKFSWIQLRSRERSALQRHRRHGRGNRRAPSPSHQDSLELGRPAALGQRPMFGVADASPRERIQAIDRPIPIRTNPATNSGHIRAAPKLTQSRSAVSSPTERGTSAPLARAEEAGTDRIGLVPAACSARRDRPVGDHLWAAFLRSERAGAAADPGICDRLACRPLGTACLDLAVALGDQPGRVVLSGVGRVCAVAARPAPVRPGSGAGRGIRHRAWRGRQGPRARSGRPRPRPPRRSCAAG